MTPKHSTDATASPLSAFIAKLRGAARRVIRGRYDLPAMVARKGRLSRWLAARALRLYYPRSMVSRRSRLAEWIAVNVRHELPTLYHFDVHITDHCNLNCKGCAHFSSICNPTFADPVVFAEDMHALAERLHVQQIWLLGGEPLLHPRVEEFVAIARRCFPRTRIRLVTNGLLVNRMGEEFWRTLAENDVGLVISAYPISLPVKEIGGRAAEHGVALELTSEGGRFFKVPIDLTGSQDPEDSFRRCIGITNCPLYRDGRLYPCAYTAFIEAFAGTFGIEGLHAAEEDSISIRDQDPKAIMEFMRRPVPFCRYCDFDHFEEYEWGRTERTIDEWTTGDTTDAASA